MLRFIARDAAPPTAEQLAALAPVKGVLARLLYARGVRDRAQAEAFLRPDASSLHDPHLLHDLPKALALLDDARAANARVCVYGDYDVDGVCATALLCEALARYGVEAEPRTPLRAEGYGLHATAVERMAGEGVELLVTVDLGITNDEEVKLAQALGMRVIVTDHHQPGPTPCPADAVLNPLLGAYPEPRLCGAGVAFKLAQALLGDGALDLLDLAALATVADVVPLTGENRTLTALGLPLISSGARPGLRALMKVSGCKGEADSYTLGFQLGPRLNAAGRLGDASAGVRLLRCADADEAQALAAELDDENARRKEIERRMLTEARKQAAAHDFTRDPLLWVRGDDWHAGVIGLVAGRLCQELCCPTIALCREGDTLRGSLRSIPGVNIHHCLLACGELLERFGGHEQAAGVTLAVEQADAFCARLQQAVRESAGPEAFEPCQPYDLALPLGRCDEALARELHQLAPFGMGNPAPLFVSEGLSIERRRACGADGAHLQLTFRQGADVRDGIAFGMGARQNALPDAADAVFAIKLNEWMGRVSVQCDVKALRPAADADERRALALPPEIVGLALLDALDAPAQAGETPADAEIQYLPDSALAGGDEAELTALLHKRRGTLFVARTRETALAFLRAYPRRTDFAVGVAPDDPRCPNALWLLPRISAARGHWKAVALLDGPIRPDEPAAWRAALPEARVLVCPPSAELCALAREADAGDDRYRALYRRLRGGAHASLQALAEGAGLSETQTRLGLRAFAQLNLVRYVESPFSCALTPPAPCTLGDAPLLRALRALSRPGEVREC